MSYERDPNVYSGQREWIADSEDKEDGGYFRHITWKELAEKRLEEIRRLQGFQKIVNDLDRNEHGRHEGDADVSDPTGVSQGNPYLQTGQVLGYDIRGGPYLMPERGKRNDPEAWRQS